MSHRNDVLGRPLLGGYKVDVGGRIGRLFFTGPEEIAIIFPEGDIEYRTLAWARQNVYMLLAS